jgi:hypothetical protein
MADMTDSAQGIPRSDKVTLAERIDAAEELLCAGLGPGHAERQLAKQYGVTPRQARRYLSAVYTRWREQSASDAPYRREKVIRMTERFYAKALAAKDFRAGAAALQILARMSGAIRQHDPERERLMAELGPPPDDPTQALVYAQRVMVHSLHEVAINTALDPERRLRWIAELGSKLGMTHAKALIEERLGVVEEHAGMGRRQGTTDSRDDDT